MSEPADFLSKMAQSSRARVIAAQQQVSSADLAQRIAELPSAPTLQLDGRFDLIAELKLRSPAMGVLSGTDADLEHRVRAYATAGAAIVSVLTEPDRFDGSLDHLQRAATILAASGVPAMRKDFLVDPYQVLEARAAGAGGVLLIVRMLDLSVLRQMMDQAAQLGLFVLLETFDVAEVDTARVLAAEWSGRPQDCLIGVNSRDLSTLQVVPERLEQLADHLPRAFARVAESGLQTPEDAARLAAAGYNLALVGTALMASPDPVALAQQMIARGRAAGTPT
jgi:indole-3-glycerol phosphate synthase